MTEDLLKSFQQAYRNLELLPLIEENDLRRFRVEYGEDTIDELIQLIEDSPNSDGKVVFTGHRGCGKSTNNIRNDFAMPLGSVDYRILQTTYQNFKPEDPKQQEFLDLLHGLYVLEYRNRQNWYDVHPIVVELLREEGLIDDSK
ncbi:hypothetical protein LC612_11980 [Nostoc sp. CHAB 5834]|nr:hypothetical protein [Nostoc sp. CHAB 5834]